MKNAENGYKNKPYKEHLEVQNKIRNTAQRVPAPRYLSMKIRLNETEYNIISRAAENAGLSIAAMARQILMKQLGKPMQQVLQELLTI